MTPTQMELHNAHKARLQRIAAAAARLNPRTDSEFSAALNAVEEPVAVASEEQNVEWDEEQIERYKRNWFSVISVCKVAKSGAPTIRSIQRATCDVYGADLKDLLSERRTWDIVLPRHVSMYLARELTELSSIRIARATGNRDHTTALNAYQKIEKLLRSNAQLAANIAEIKRRLAR